jgi:GAF domain-containing protein
MPQDEGISTLAGAVNLAQRDNPAENGQPDRIYVSDGDGGLFRMTTTVRERALNRAFADLAESLVGDFDVADLLHRLVTLVTELLSADAASVLLSDVQGELQVMASSSEATQTLELYQLQTGQGPCLDCYRTGRPVSIPDLTAVTNRWALFVPTAQEQGYAAVHSVPMRVRDQVLGAMNLFSAESGDLPESDLHAAQALADVATIGLLHERASRLDTMAKETQERVHERYLVEQAKGMLAASGISMDEAYDLLRHYARYRDDRLLEVSADLAAGRVEPAQIIAAGRLSRP